MENATNRTSREGMTPVLVLNDTELRSSHSGLAYMPRFRTPSGKVIEVSVGKSKATIDLGLLWVEEWIMRRSDGLAFAFANKFESLDGTPIEAGDTPVAVPAREHGIQSAGCSIKKGFFTVVRDGDKHLTFRLKTNRKGQTVIGVMNGSNNLSDYVWFGFATDAGIKFWRSANAGYGVPAILPITHKEASDAFDTIIGDPTTAGGLYAKESKRCCRCNRILTNPNSIDNLFGPECINFQFG